MPVVPVVPAFVKVDLVTIPTMYAEYADCFDDDDILDRYQYEDIEMNECEFCEEQPVKFEYPQAFEPTGDANSEYSDALFATRWPGVYTRQYK